VFWNPRCGYCRAMHDKFRRWERNQHPDASRPVAASSGDEDSIRAWASRLRCSWTPTSPLAGRKHRRHPDGGPRECGKPHCRRSGRRARRRSRAGQSMLRGAVRVTGLAAWPEAESWTTQPRSNRPNSKPRSSPGSDRGQRGFGWTELTCPVSYHPPTQPE
jgi:hypothetical protein